LDRQVRHLNGSLFKDRRDCHLEAWHGIDLGCSQFAIEQPHGSELRKLGDTAAFTRSQCRFQKLP
jgi:hypothetical protein